MGRGQLKWTGELLLLYFFKYSVSKKPKMGLQSRRKTYSIAMFLYKMRPVIKPSETSTQEVAVTSKESITLECKRIQEYITQEEEISS